MDSIDPHSDRDRLLMVEYAVLLHERFRISIDVAVNEVKRLLEDKKNGILNVTVWIK